MLAIQQVLCWSSLILSKMLTFWITILMSQLTYQRYVALWFGGSMLAYFSFWSFSSICVRFMRETWYLTYLEHFVAGSVCLHCKCCGQHTKSSLGQNGGHCYCWLHHWWENAHCQRLSGENCTRSMWCQTWTGLSLQYLLSFFHFSINIHDYTCMSSCTIL